MSEVLARHWPQLLAASLAIGLASANAGRAGALALAAAVSLFIASLVVANARRFGLLAVALAFVGWWWGSARLETLDRSSLAAQVGRAASARVVVTGPARRGRFETRLPAVVMRFGALSLREPVLVELPRGRAPPQGVILAAVATVRAPRGPENVFDESAWLRHRGIHVVLGVDRWRVVARRGGLLAVADALRRRLQRTVAVGVGGDRAAVLRGVVLGDDDGLSDELRDRFRAAGLYHLLAVSGQNVGLVAGGALAIAWLSGLPRLIGHLGALAAIGAYVIAVGAQPSVVRAGIAGALASLAWITARAADRWHFLLVGAVALLAWNPYTLLDAGFQFSFAAVAAIFLLVPRFERYLEGYPLGRPLRLIVAVSAACGLATAPIAWLQFHSVQVLTVPANALAAPATVPLLGLGLATAALAPLSSDAAAALAWLNGWCSAYLAAVARVIGGLPFAQIESTRTMLIVVAGVFLAAAYAWPRWRQS